MTLIVQTGEFNNLLSVMDGTVQKYIVTKRVCVVAMHLKNVINNVCCIRRGVRVLSVILA